MDKLDSRKLKSKTRRKAAASARRYTRWQAAATFVAMLVCIAALSIFLFRSGTKSHAVPEETVGGDSSFPISAPPKQGPKVEVEPFLPPSSASKSRGSRVLTGSFPSAEALTGQFLKQLARGDEESIKALRITKDEFCNYVWPDLPSSRLPNVSCDWAWDQATLNSLSGLSEMIPQHGGKSYEIVSIRFAKGTDTYSTYKVHKEPWLTLRDKKGTVREMRLFGSMLEMDGQFKLFSFVVD